MPAASSGPGPPLRHMGRHKTGTSSIQGALYLARERLAAQGVFSPGQGRTVLWPILAVTGQPPLLGEPTPKTSYWENRTGQIAATGDQRGLLTIQFFFQAEDPTPRRLVKDLGGDRGHLVVALRLRT